MKLKRELQEQLQIKLKGKKLQVFWPTVPTMTFGEELVIQEAPQAKSAGVQFLNFTLVVSLT